MEAEQKQELSKLAADHASRLEAAEAAAAAKEAAAQEQMTSSAAKAKADMKVRSCIVNRAEEAAYNTALTSCIRSCFVLFIILINAPARA